MPIRKHKAFTLVELLVAMAIIGILIGLALYGISAAQRSSRDTARKDALKQISAGIQDYYGRNSAYPTEIYFSATDEAIYIKGTSGTTCTASNTCVIVPLKGSAKPSSDEVGNTNGLKTGTDAGQTKYCYAMATSGYYLGACLETEQKYEANTTSSGGCSMTCP